MRRRRRRSSRARIPIRLPCSGRRTPHGRIVRAFLPGAVNVDVLRRADGAVMASLKPRGGSGLFENLVPDQSPYLLRIVWPGATQETEDPYSFGVLLGDLDLHLFNEGRHFGLAHCLGAQSMTVEGVSGVRFAVWAPNATRVAVVGDFNSWDGRRHPMRVRHLPASGNYSSPASHPARIINTIFAGLGASNNLGKRILSPAKANLP